MPATGLARLPVAATGAVVALLLLPVALVILALGAQPPPATGTIETLYGVSAYAARDIPPAALAAYQAAGRRYGVDWAVLAAIGKHETDHGRSRLPGVRSGVNSYGCCAGPMQIWIVPPHPDTWDRFGVDFDGDGRKNVYDIDDAAAAAARILRAGGAPRDYRAAIYTYDHSDAYVAWVLRMAERYRGRLRTIGGVAPLTPGSRARIGAGGRVARAPTNTPAAIRRMIAAGNELQGLPYGAAGHPDPVGAPSQDCSSTTSYVLYRGGFMGRTSLVSSNFLSWGRPGPGRWITIWAKPGFGPNGHVFILIAGLRLDTNYGYDTGPNAGLRGPRWRLGPYPTRAQGYVVRHPAGW